MMNNVRDNSEKDDNMTSITSGSFGEGLQLRGSDLDIMSVTNYIEVCEDIHHVHIDLNADKVYVIMEMKDTQPGFSKLRLLHTGMQSIFRFCDKIDNDFYLSSHVYKHSTTNSWLSTIHGPCLSDKYGFLDLVFCLRSKLWITSGRQWLTRSNSTWPSYDVKQAIVKHGVLFVPIGVKGSTNEELEWRISFSVGEKLLFCTFTHTQLLCYALMKILLKDVIALDIDCKELLCSYFMKTVLFWISEELPSSIWKPANLIHCFMRCFRRLIYCVEYAVCPHYFIPENNLFENKIHGHAQETLLKRLHILNSYGWQCILLSDQISNVHVLAFDIIKESNNFYVNSIQQIFTPTMVTAEFMRVASAFHLEKVIYNLLSCNSSKIKYLYIYNMSRNCLKSGRFLPFDEMSGNKSIYTHYTNYISTLILSTRHDAVSGWLMLASFFYRSQQYNKALHIVNHSLLNCSPEQLIHLNMSDIYYDLLKLHVTRQMNIVQLLNFFRLEFVIFKSDSMLVPKELETGEMYIIPPVVYRHFLRFLCHYHLRNSRQCREALEDLKLTIAENFFFIRNPLPEAYSYYILGISCQLVGDEESARQAFMRDKFLCEQVGLYTE
ncbi:uncharacterized protein LOC134696075 isoform X2 [Mytilus trossulus]